jgi:hypothetical protein
VCVIGSRGRFTNGDGHEEDRICGGGAERYRRAIVALSACTGRYYERDYRDYGDSRYDSAVPGSGVYYSDRAPGNPYYTDYPNREYRDRDGRRF